MPEGSSNSTQNEFNTIADLMLEILNGKRVSIVRRCLVEFHCDYVLSGFAMLTHLPPGQDGRHFAFSKIFSWIKKLYIDSKFTEVFFLGAKLTIRQHWFRPLSEPVLIQLLTCHTRGRRVNSLVERQSCDRWVKQPWWKWEYSISV